MKKILLCLFTFSAVALSAQVEIEPFAPSVGGTYIGDFNVSPLTSVPGTTAWTTEGSTTSPYPFVGDNGLTLFGYDVGAVGNYCAVGLDLNETFTLVSPEMDFGSNTLNPTMNFRWGQSQMWADAISDGYCAQGFEIMYKESSGGAWNVITNITTIDAVNMWTDDVIDLSGASSYSTFYIGIRVTSLVAGSLYGTLNYGQTVFDEIVITGEPGCTATTNSFPVTMCDTYTVPSGDETYTTTGIVNDTIPNMAGCDSVLTIDVTIETVDPAVSETGGTITSAQAGASYQWIDCSDSSDVAGATSQSFTPTSNGDYAVMVTNGSCVDTSACTTIAGIGFDENSLEAFRLFPNPTDGNVTIQFIDFKDVAGVEVYSADGKLVANVTTFSSQSTLLDLSDIKTGLYIVKITDDQFGSKTERLIIR